MMGVGVGCVDEKHIIYDDRKKRITFYDVRVRGRGRGRRVRRRIKAARSRS